MFSSTPFLNQYTKSLINDGENLNRILHKSPNDAWNQLDSYTNNVEKITANDQYTNKGRLNGLNSRIQDVMDRNPETIAEKTLAERENYNKYMREHGGINNSVSEERIIDTHEGFNPVQRRLVMHGNIPDWINKDIREPFEMKMKSRCGPVELIIIVLVIIGVFVIVNLYISQKRTEIMMHYYMKYMKKIQKE